VRGALLGLLMFPATAQAQTHPCDLAPVTAIQASGPIAIGFCVRLVDADGNPVPLTSVISFRIKVDEAQVFNGPLSPVGVPSPTGSLYYETPKTISVSRGSHTVIAYVTTTEGGESDGSDPFVFVFNGVPLGKPIVKGPKK
jgi:hypothetical protein